MRPGELGFGLLELAQALLPLALEAAGDETVLGIDSAIAAFGTLCLVPGPFSGEPALGERIVAIGFEPFGGGESGFETRWTTLMAFLESTYGPQRTSAVGS